MRSTQPQDTGTETTERRNVYDSRLMDVINRRIAKSYLHLSAPSIERVHTRLVEDIAEHNRTHAANDALNAPNESALYDRLCREIRSLDPFEVAAARAGRDRAERARQAGARKLRALASANRLLRGADLPEHEER